MEMPDKYTVVFNLKQPNSRFHGYFTVRWAACWMMPKHIFEKESDPLAFKFNPPVSLSAYKLKDFDPNGNWYLWEKREDWQKTSMGLIGEPGPKYAMYTAPGPSDKRVIAQTQHNLDVIHDLAPEGMIKLAKESKSLGWLVPQLPVGAPGPHPADGHLQQREAGPRSKGSALGAHPGDRHRPRVTRLVPRRGNDLGDPRSADGTVSQVLLRPARVLAQRLHHRRRRQPVQTLRPRRVQSHRGGGSQDPRRPRPDRPGRDQGRARSRLVEARPGGGRATDAGGRDEEGRRQVGAARRLTVQDRAVECRREQSDDEPGGEHGRGVLERVRHRREPRRPGQCRRPGQPGRLFGCGRLDDRDLGWPPGPVLLPELVALEVLCPVREAGDRLEHDALEAPRAGSHHHRDPGTGLRRSEGDRARPGVHQARGGRDARHPDDELQRVHRL